MSLKDCVNVAVQNGEMTLEEGEALKQRYDNLAKRVLTTGKAKEQLLKDLDAEAANRMRAAMLTETVRKGIQSDIESFRAPNGDKDIVMGWLYKHEHLGHEGKMPYMDAATLHKALTSESHTRIEKALHAFRKGWLRGDLKRSDRFGDAGTVTRLDDVVKSLFGETVKDDTAKALAQVLGDEMERLRVAYNDAGGNIPKLEKWGLPQWHDRMALLNKGHEAWVDYLMKDGVLDRERMADTITGIKMTDAELRDALSDAWKEITTDGFASHTPTGAPQGKGALWKQKMDHRFLHFKNAEEWLKYARDFGTPDPYATIMGHVNRMNRDIAHMTVFGPNPEAVRNYFKDYIKTYAAKVRPFEKMAEEKLARLHAIRDQLDAGRQKLTDRLHMIPRELAAIREKGHANVSFRNKRKLEALHKEFKSILSDLNGATKNFTDTKLELEFQQALDDLDGVARMDFVKSMDPVTYVAGLLDRSDEMWQTMRGQSLAPINPVMANTLNAARSWITASVLGKAVISALSDTAFASVRRAFTGMGFLKSNLFSTFKDTLKYTLPSNRAEAVRSGLILDEALHVFHEMARYTGSMDTRRLSGFLADRTLSMSGLNAWTQAGKHAGGMALQGLFADHAGQGFARLPDAIRNTLDRHGITAADWDQIRAAEIYEPQSDAKFLRPQDIATAAGQDLSRKYIAMILREMQFMVPETTVRSRSLYAGVRSGSIIGEISKSGAQFKSFGIAVAMTQLGHVLNEFRAGRPAQGAQYAAHLFITTALMGLFAMALRDIAAGRDPRRWTDDETFADPNMIGAAVLQAGGLGIFGDFLFSNLSRHDQSLAGTAAGPIWDRFDNLRQLTLGNAQLAMQGKPTKFTPEMLRFVRANTPGLSSIWYTSLAYNRILLDEIQKMTDPQAYVAFQRQKSKFHNEYKQDFWWDPGETLPHRAPDAGAIVRKH